MPETETHSGLNRRYLRVQDLRRLRSLFFASRRIVEGLYTGRHASPQRGHSVEFNDYREYFPGDEIGDIDWKVFGRTDRLMIKLFEHQSDMTVHLLVDASASMGYRGAGAKEQGLGTRGKKKAPSRSTRLIPNPKSLIPDSKYDHACRMAASIAFLTTKQQDKVSLSLVQNGMARFDRPMSSVTHLANILRAMEEIEPAREARLPEALKQLASLSRRRGVLVIFSDLLDDFEAVNEALSIHTHRGSEVILFHVMHADELHLPAMHEAIFEDSETGGKVTLNVDDVREAYDRQMKDFLHKWNVACRGKGIDYNLVSTATPYTKSLENYLFSRVR
jgi:uncharacterized protein (DUF58 family)